MKSIQFWFHLLKIMNTTAINKTLFQHFNELEPLVRATACSFKQSANKTLEIFHVIWIPLLSSMVSQQFEYCSPCFNEILWFPPHLLFVYLVILSPFDSSTQRQHEHVHWIWLSFQIPDFGEFECWKNEFSISIHRWCVSLEFCINCWSGFSRKANGE